MNKQSKRLRAITIALVCSLVTPAFASASIVSIIGYDTTNPNGATGAPSPDLDAAQNVADVAPLQFARGPGLVANQGITLNSSGWSTASTLDTSLGDFLSWGWNSGGGVYDLEDLTIQYDRSGAGPEQIAILLSINGGAAQTIFTDGAVDPTDETHTIDLTNFDNVVSARFELHDFDASSTGGTFDVERFTTDPDPSLGIQVRGVSAVPEPSTYLFLAALGGVFWGYRRKKVA